MKQSKFLSLKEFVIVLLLACVETAIGLVVTMPFAANLQLVYFLAPGLAGLINGIIYVLIIKKCPKIGTQFIIPAIYGLYFLFSGSVYVFIFFMILAVVNELIMLGGGYRSKIRSAVPHTLTWICLLYTSLVFSKNDILSHLRFHTFRIGQREGRLQSSAFPHRPAVLP